MYIVHICTYAVGMCCCCTGRRPRGSRSRFIDAPTLFSPLNCVITFTLSTSFIFQCYRDDIFKTVFVLFAAVWYVFSVNDDTFTPEPKLFYVFPFLKKDGYLWRFSTASRILCDLCFSWAQRFFGLNQCFANHMYCS